MIAEAHDNNTVGSIIIIAAILEVGGIIGNNNRYHPLTEERESDLLAQLDIWDKISKFSYDELNSHGILKEKLWLAESIHKKIREKLEEQDIDCGSSGTRENTLKACITGLADRIFCLTDESLYIKGDGDYTYALNRHSVLNSKGTLVMGIPRTYESLGEIKSDSADYVIHMPSIVKYEWLREGLPHLISEKESDQLVYDPAEDTVRSEVNVLLSDTLVIASKHGPAYPQHEDAPQAFAEWLASQMLLT